MLASTQKFHQSPTITRKLAVGLFEGVADSADHAGSPLGTRGMATNAAVYSEL